jgi:hypothetical protein
MRQNFLSKSNLLHIIFAIAAIIYLPLNSESAEPNNGAQKNNKSKIQPSHYITYVNKKFGFSFEYPDSFKQKEPSKENNYVTEINPDSEEGVDLMSPDWDVEIIAMGGNNINDNFDGKETKSEYLTVLGFHPEASYKVLTHTWFVISWISDENPTQGPAIAYLKHVYGKKSNCSFKITYPKSQKKKWDPLLKHLIETFKTPGLDITH